MIDESGLRLYESMFLLALDDTKGTTSGNRHVYAMAAAIVAELVSLGRLSIDQNKRKHVLQVANTRLTGDQLLDECFHRIQSSSRPQTLFTWINRFIAIRGLVGRVADRLWLTGLLRREERPVLFVFRRRVYLAQNPLIKARMRDRLRSVVLSDGPVDTRDVFAIVLARQSGLISRLLDRKEQKQRRARIDAITKTNPLGKALRDAISSGHAHSVVV